MIPDLPGWDSLPAVTRYHNWAEMAGIVAVAVLVVAEIVQYKYGHRRDDLTTQEQTATNQRHDEEMARLHLETAQANRNAAELALALEQEHERISDRRLSEEQIKMLKDAVDMGIATRHRYTGEPKGCRGILPDFDIGYLVDDREAQDLAFHIYAAIPGAVRNRIPLGEYEFLPNRPSGIAFFDPDGDSTLFSETIKKVFPAAEFRNQEWMYTLQKTNHRTLYIWPKPLAPR